MARPTNLTDEVLETARDYVENYQSYGDVVPSVVGLCKAINRSKSSVYRWAEEENNGFWDTLEAIKENQERVTLNGSLTNEFNAAISKLILANHGYSDKQEIKAQLRDVSTITDAELEAIAAGSR
jgi:hypothetical protein